MAEKSEYETLRSRIEAIANRVENELYFHALPHTDSLQLHNAFFSEVEFYLGDRIADNLRDRSNADD